jgi:hypothetical protein
MAGGKRVRRQQELQLEARYKSQIMNFSKGANCVIISNPDKNSMIEAAPLADHILSVG